MKLLDDIKSGIGFIKARLEERSTWIWIGTAVAGASSLPKPWNYFSLAVGVIAGMCPNKDEHDNHQ